MPHRARARRGGNRPSVPHHRGIVVSVTVVQGADPVLRDREVQRLVDQLLAGDDRSFALDDHTLAARRRAGDSAPESDDDADDRGGEGSTELPAFAALATAL